MLMLMSQVFSLAYAYVMFMRVLILMLCLCLCLCASENRPLMVNRLRCRLVYKFDLNQSERKLSISILDLRVGRENAVKMVLWMGSVSSENT